MGQSCPQSLCRCCIALTTEEAAPGPDSRIIWVFLSSTFLDCMEERDLLVVQVVSELRRKARERGLRWWMWTSAGASPRRKAFRAR
jgi:hypothetical protein